MTKKTKTHGRSSNKQLKIDGTGRIDAIAELEEQAAKYLELREERKSTQEKEEAEQLALTSLLAKHKLDRYVFEDGEGEKFEVYLLEASKAKVRKLKAEQPEGDAE